MEQLFNQVDHLVSEKRVPRLQGWCSKEKARALVELILEHRPPVSVEIGVFGGMSLIAQALACKYLGHGRVHGIDPWSVDDALDGVQEKENIDWWRNLNYEQIYKGCLAAVLECDVTNYCTIVRTNSDRAHGMFDYIDVLHIDGNHSEKASTLDVFLYLPKVRSGGFVWFDDFDWHSTKNAVRLVEEKCEAVKEVGTCRLYKKS
jgi:predicted O-methyltransferase YrrM